MLLSRKQQVKQSRSTAYRVPHGIHFTFLLMSHKHSWFFWSHIHLNSLRYSFELKEHRTTLWIPACLLSPHTLATTHADLIWCQHKVGCALCVKHNPLSYMLSFCLFFLAAFANFYSSYLNPQFTKNSRMLFNSPGSLHQNPYNSSVLSWEIGVSFYVGS